jgi:hypothetical protein
VLFLCCPFYLPTNVVLGKGRVLGATTTVPSREGDILIAFLALFVSLTGAHLWKIICFIIHQLRSTRAEEDGMYHQIQVILPSGLDDLSMLWRFCRVSWAWRGKTRRVGRRVIFLIIVCLVNFTAINIAGLFVSRVSDSADEVIIQSNDNCGWYDVTPVVGLGIVGNLTDDQINSLDSLAISSHASFSGAHEYAKSCYPLLNGFVPNNSSSDCITKVVPYISSSVNQTAACPFAEKACIGSAISLDSGWIDSNLHLGINTAASESIRVRRSLTCAPIPLEDSYSLPWMEGSQFSALDPDLSPHLRYKIFRVGPALHTVDPIFGALNGSFFITNQTIDGYSPNFPM